MFWSSESDACTHAQATEAITSRPRIRSSCGTCKLYYGVWSTVLRWQETIGHCNNVRRARRLDCNVIVPWHHLLERCGSIVTAWWACITCGGGVGCMEALWVYLVRLELWAYKNLSTWCLADGKICFKDTSSNGTFRAKDHKAQELFTRLPRGEMKTLEIGQRAHSQE